MTQINKLISSYRNAVRDDWGNKTYATFLDMQEAERDIVNAFADLQCCGNCIHSSSCQQMKEQILSPRDYCENWNPNGRTAEERIKV